jgi:hypothetical protein
MAQRTAAILIVLMAILGFAPPSSSAVNPPRRQTLVVNAAERQEPFVDTQPATPSPRELAKSTATLPDAVAQHRTAHTACGFTNVIKQRCPQRLRCLRARPPNER